MILESKNLELAGCYHQEPMSYDALLEWCRVQAGQFAPYICDVGPSCSRPTTAASASCWKPSWVPCGISTTASSRLPPAPIRWRPMHRWGRHPQLQAGPCGGRAESLLHLRGCRTLCGRERHGRSVERAAAQGRRRVRCRHRPPAPGGPFDCVASRYGLAMQGADKIALTKLDVLSSLKEIPVITGYKLDGVEVPAFDPLSDLDRVEPVVTMPARLGAGYFRLYQLGRASRSSKELCAVLGKAAGP